MVSAPRGRIVAGPDELRASGVLLADGAPVTCWIARLERVSEPRKHL
jgi:hypothetical protein